MSTSCSPAEYQPADATAATRVRDAVNTFTQAGGRRAVAVEALRGPAVRVEVNAHTPQPGASTLKLIVAAAVHDAADAGQIDLSERVNCRDLHPTIFPTVMAAFDDGDQLALRQLCALMLITSDNAAADALLDRVGHDTVNATARRLGATATTLAVDFRDEQLGAAGRRNTTTAGDLNLILRGLAGHERYRPVLASMRNNLRNTRIPARLPDRTPVAHKTGSLDGVVCDAGIIYGQHTDVAVAFLADGESDSARTSIAIADTVATIWSALTELAD
ncbi:beta-lactamase class A [Frankia torreyi]|uniref:Beta-lactamase class A n=1 Tax=Frankia torreyi TaxID=1856 RepID=A0A0D8BAH1_9ACTN|nr:serine hydrolase [Frankia torreyi]KJE21110.1 beta-lactamase class A [Frankia torreyi]